MDRTTEPVIAVLGHPIAGNPAQFALLRAFDAMRLDWRVLSFDVLPAQLHTALDGLDVLGFEGVLIAATLSAAASQWSKIAVAQQPPDEPESFDDGLDCLFRARRDVPLAERAPWRRQAAAAEWLAEAVRSHFALRGRSLERWMFAGDETLLSQATLGAVPDEVERVAFEPDQVDSVDLIVLAPPAPPARKRWLGLDQWPRSDASTLVVDLLGTAPPASWLERGYSSITADELQVGTLSRCVKTWTGQDPPIDVLREAVEEFSAV